MIISYSELEADLDKYLLLSADEDIYIELNGRLICKMTNPDKDEGDIEESLSAFWKDINSSEEETFLNKIGPLL